MSFQAVLRSLSGVTGNTMERMPQRADFRSAMSCHIQVVRPIRNAVAYSQYWPINTRVTGANTVRHKTIKTTGRSRERSGLMMRSGG